MKRVYYLNIILIFLCIFAISASDVTAKTLYDDFSETYLDSSKWNNQELVREVNQEKLVLKVRNSTANEHAYHHTLFKGPELITSSIQYDISVKKAILDSGTDSLSFVRIQGFFYNTQNGGGATGDVAAILYLGNRGIGLEAWWEVHEADDDERSSFTERGSGTLAVPDLDYENSYTALLEYDGDHGFTFTVGGVSASFTTGPEKLGNVVTQHKAFRTGAYTEGGTGDGYVSATIDNVFTNGTAYDDFSTPPLDQTKWQELEFVREIESGKLRLTAHSNENRETTHISFAHIKQYMEATVTIKNESWFNAGAYGRTRIDGNFYNDTYGPGSGKDYIGYEGDVWAHVYIDYYDDGTLEAKCYAERILDADGNTTEKLLSGTFDLPILPGQPYTFSIRFTGTKFIFTCKDTETGQEEVLEHDIITTSVFEPYDNDKSILSRIYGNGSGGYMAVEIDNVYVEDVYSEDSEVEKTLYDAFSGTSLSNSKWEERELVREVVGEELVSKVGNSTNDEQARNNTSLQDPSLITAIQCDIKVIAANLDTGTDTESFARIDGFFYNSQGAGGATGDIWAGVYIGDRGNGLEAYWSVAESLADDQSSFDDLGSGAITVPGLDYGNTYTVILEYDGANVFTFTVAGVSATFNTGPARQGDAITSYKGLTVGAYSNGGSGTGYTSAIFDNVMTNAIAYDNFSTAPLDQTKWKELEVIREIEDDKLRLAAHSNGDTKTVPINFPEIHPYIEATFTVKSESWFNAGASGRTRIAGFFYNDTYGPGSGSDYNGYEGNIWANVRIDYQEDGTLRAACSADRSMNADDTIYEGLLWHQFNVPIIVDRAYTLSIHFTGTKFVFTCRDTITGQEEVLEHDIITSAYEAYDSFRALRSRVYGNGTSGYMAVEIDNVYVDSRGIGGGGGGGGGGCFLTALNTL